MAGGAASPAGLAPLESSSALASVSPAPWEQCPAPSAEVQSALESTLHIPTSEYRDLLERLNAMRERAESASNNIALYDSAAMLQAQMDDLRRAQGPRLGAAVIVPAQGARVQAYIIGAWIEDRDGGRIVESPALWLSTEGGQTGYAFNQVAAESSILPDANEVRRDIGLSQTDPGVVTALVCLGT